MDEHLVVASKPSGLLVHRGWDNDDDVALFRVRDAIGAYVYPIHRLDRGTSGALLFARSKDVARELARGFGGGLHGEDVQDEDGIDDDSVRADGDDRTRLAPKDVRPAKVEKSYLALVRGVPPEGGVIDYAIQRAEDGPRVPARTRFQRIACSTVDRCALVLASPETGRLHQIRRHLRHIDHPLVGDVRHGSGAINRHYRATYGLHRLALHACRLAFDHPVTGERLVVDAPMPDDLGDALDKLGLPRSVEAS